LSVFVPFVFFTQSHLNALAVWLSRPPAAWIKKTRKKGNRRKGKCKSACSPLQIAQASDDQQHPLALQPLQTTINSSLTFKGH